MKQPNILFILNDHQSFYGQGINGGPKPARPNFDRLASGGINFNRAYTTCALCTPARRSMLSGLLPHNHGYLTLAHTDWREQKSEELVFSRMREAGYDCSYVGKWHAGQGTALDLGCEGFSLPGYGNPYNSKEYRQYLKEKGLPPMSVETLVAFCEGSHLDHAKVGKGLMCHCRDHTWHVAGLLETPNETHECYFLADAAKKQLQKHAGQDTPFFMSVHFWGPHAPFLSGKSFADQYPPESFAEYPSFREELSHKCRPYRFETNNPIADDNNTLISPPAIPWSEWQKIYHCDWGGISMVDDAGGQILDELDRLGLSDDTLVIWTTDHGHPAGAHGGHFDKNAFLCEENMRIPMAMRLPGRVPEGIELDSLVSNMDVPVTIAALAGNPFHGETDGENLLALADESSRDSWRKSLMCETHGHHGEPVRGRLAVTDQYTYAVYDYSDEEGVQEEAFDLDADPYQMDDLTCKAGNGELVGELRHTLSELQAESRDEPILTGARTVQA